MRVLGIIAVTVGAALLVGTPVVFVHLSRVQRQDQSEVAAMQQELAAARALLAHAATAADSAELGARIAARQDGIGRRMYHVQRVAADLAAWWRPTGMGTIMMALGALVAAGGGIALRRASAT